MSLPRWFRGAALAVAVAALLVVWLYPTDEKRVRAAAEAIVAAANEGAGPLSAALDEHASSSVRLTVPELSEPLVGKAAIVAALGPAESMGGKVHLRLESVQVTVEGKRARVTADLLTLPGPEVPELRRPRHGSALFERRGDRFRLSAVDIGSERLDQPEARP